jgi:hypothetical protein
LLLRSVGFSNVEAEIKSAANQSVNSQSGNDDPQANKTHLLAGSYYSVRGGLSATLMLNNKGPKPLEVRPTLYNLAGDRQEISPVTVEGNSFRMIDLRDWIALGGETFKEGSVQLFHRGRDLVLGAQIYLVDDEHSLSFDEKLVEIGPYGSTRLEGIWWKPSRRSEVRIILSNSSSEPLSVTARLAGARPGQSGPRIFNLSPHETRVLNVSQEFSDAEASGQAEMEAISLEHAGPKSALLARGMVQDARKGYSSTVQFSNPLGGKSQQYHGAGLRFGKVAGEMLTPIVVARNVGDTATVLNGRIPYTTRRGETGVVALASTKLRPGEMKLIDLPQVIKKGKVEQKIAAAGLEFDYTTAPGSVMVSAQSVSSDGNQVFRVPMWDPLTQRSPTGGYPWYIEGDSSTTVYIKNITNHPQHYIAHILFPGGIYTAGLQTVEGKQTVAFNLRELRDKQVPDEEGRTIPTDVSRGQILWSLYGNEAVTDDLENLALVGRSEQFDTDKAISSNYACQNCCINSYVPDSARIDPFFPSAGEVGDQVQFKASEERETCYLLPLRSNVSAGWLSTNTGAVTINSSGQATGKAPGSTTITALWTTRAGYVFPCDHPPQLSAAASTDETAVVDPAPDPDAVVDDPPDPDIGCGGCRYSNIPVSAIAFWSVKEPRVTISPPQLILDGTTANFSVVVNGGTPTGYQWSYDAPTGAANNPNVTFTPNGQAQTKTNGHWFALPNDPCLAAGISTYDILCTVTFSTGYTKTVEGILSVNARLPKAGVTNPKTAGITGIPAMAADANGVWHVIGVGGLQRKLPDTPVINFPFTSQFYNKTYRHEREHAFNQWQPGHLFGKTYVVADVYALIKNLTGTSEANLFGKVIQQFQIYSNQQDAFIDANASLSETFAYIVSDPIAPRYIYQGTCPK